MEDFTNAVLMLVEQFAKIEKELAKLRDEKKHATDEVHNPHDAVIRCLKYMAHAGGVWETTRPGLSPWAMWLKCGPDFKFMQDDLRNFIRKYNQEQIELRNFRAGFEPLGQVRKSDQDKKVDDKKIQELADCWTGSGLGGLQGR